MNPKGEKLGTCDLEGIKGPLTELPEVDLEFNTWLGVLNPTSWGSKSQLQYYESSLILALIPLAEHNITNLSI